MKPLVYLAAIVAMFTLAACGETQTVKTQTANAQDRAQRLCQSTAHSHHLRISSSDEPVQIDHDRYMIKIRTRDAAGLAERSCEADLSRGRATIL